MLLSKSDAHPNGIGNSSGHVGHNFCEHVMGPGVYGLVKDLVGKPRTLDDGRPGSFYIPRFRNLSERHPNFIRGYGFEGGSGTSMFPGNAMDTPGFGSATRSRFAITQARSSGWGVSEKCFRDTKTYMDIDPEVKDKWGVPALRFHYKFGDNEKKMAAGHGGYGARDVRGSGHRNNRS